MSVVAIVNPVSGRGDAAKAWNKVQAHLKAPVRTLETKGPGHAMELTANAIRDGAETIVAVGGDGTINEVVNGFFEQDKLISDAATLGILPHGTGSDFQRSLILPESDEGAAALIQGEKSRLVDVLKVRYTKPEGAWASRYSVNMTSFGMGGIVASRLSRSRILSGRASFVVATLRTAATFAGSSVTISFDNSTTIETRVTNVAVGNGQYHGGGMLACPRAEIDDGFLDVTVIQFLGLTQLVGSLRLLYNGKIYSHPKVQFFRAKSVRADSKQPTLIELDGEPLGRLPIEIFLVPRALRILA